MSEEYKIPEHVAIILDGNGRWAKQRHMPRNFGHKAGADNLEQIIEDAWDLGIKYLTVYAFSTENWKRSVEEVTGLMLILRDFLRKSIDKAASSSYGAEEYFISQRLITPSRRSRSKSIWTGRSPSSVSLPRQE